jgi:hypothetical protein
MAGFPKGKVKTPQGIRYGDKASNPQPGVPLDKEKLKELIIKYKGNVTRAAIALGCSRHSITRIVNTNSDVKATLEEARERVIDEVEDAFTRRAIQGDTTASIFFLKTRARDRGYDQDFKTDIQAVTRAALEFALNKSKNPAES